MNMKKFVAIIIGGAMINAFGYPAEYSGDVSTPEKRVALMSELWVKDAAKELIPVWPKGTLALSEGAAPYKLLENELHQRNLILGEVVEPHFAFFRAPGEGAKPMVVVFPGGAYHYLGWNKEGTEIAEWLNSLGFSAAVLLYRTDDRDAALSDAQRLIRILRSQADEYQIKPDKIGVIGFSAGANLAVRLSTNWRKSAYARIDEVDDVSCRPDFMLPIYPWDLRPRKNPANPWQGWLKTHELDAAYPVDAETPPAFIVQAEDDFCEVATAAGLSVALTKAGVANQVNLYSDGGHGYGRRILGHATDIWSHYAALWLAKFLE